jgi:hypothetical protein
LALPYYDLDWTARRQVWKIFISHLPQEAANLSKEDYDELAKSVVNGRDIKNLIKTGLTLAVSDKPLRMRHLKIMLQLQEEIESSGNGESVSIMKKRKYDEFSGC